MRRAGRVRSPERFEPPEDDDGEPVDRVATLRRRVAAEGFGQVRKTPWRFGRDLEWVTRVGETREASTLEIGVRVTGTGARATAWVVEHAFDPALDAGDAEDEELEEESEGSAVPCLIALVLSPAGRHLGVVTGGPLSDVPVDQYHLAIVDGAVAAGKAYNLAGLIEHRRRRYAAAAELFRKAAFADPSSPVATYNLACALARTGHAETRAALALAIDRQGPKLKAKAREDPDLEKVREAPWFRELTR